MNLEDTNKMRVELDEKFCRCGKEWGEHVYSALSIIPKDKCVICFAPIEATISWFEARGNYCLVCNALAEKLVKGWRDKRLADFEIERRKSQYVVSEKTE